MPHLIMFIKAIKQMWDFIGLTAGLSKFVENVSTVIEPITQLLRENSRLTEKSREKLAPTPAYPRLDLQFRTHMDASNSGIYAILTHVQDDKEKVIRYASRRLWKAERNYTVAERECLAIL